MQPECKEKNPRVCRDIYSVLKTVKHISVFPLSIIIDAISCCDKTALF